MNRGENSRVAEGRAAEQLAADFLQQHGYVVLDRNARGGSGELDIVGRWKDLLIFIEVKAHQQAESSLQAMTLGKQRRLISAAQAWRVRHQKLAQLQCRFDVIIVSPISSNITHYEDAFRQ